MTGQSVEIGFPFGAAARANHARVLRSHEGELLIIDIDPSSIAQIDETGPTGGESVVVYFVRKTGSDQASRQFEERTMKLGEGAEVFGIHATLLRFEMVDEQSGLAVFSVSVDAVS